MRAGLAIAGLALTGGVIALSGCGGGAQSGDTVSRPITFPVLWAATDAKGLPVGGIEPAGIALATKDAPGFTVHLDDIKAKGAGPQWLASTAMAGAVATLVSGADPSSIDLGYSITGPIDGPSGGAALTVGTIAAIRGDAVLPKITMTGTVSPDGTIGTVGMVPTKIRAAAKAGYTTVIIPPGNVNAVDATTGREVFVPALGKSLGVTVREAQGVAQAYKVLTGRSLVPTGTTQPVVTPAATRTARRLTLRSIAALQAAGGSAADLAAARGAVASGDLALAYGLALDARQRVARSAAEQAVQTAIARDGVGAVRTRLVADARALATTAAAATTTQADPTGLDAGQLMTLPTALGWATYARASTEGIVTYLTRGPASAAAARGAARVLADNRLAVTAFGPDAVAMVHASPSKRSLPGDRVASFLNGYGNFMVRVGKANVDVLQQVARGQVGEGTAGDILLPFNALAARVAATPAAQNPMRDEIVQSADAITFYVLGNTLVTGSSFGLSGFGLGADPVAASPSSLEFAVRASTLATRGWLGVDQDRGWNVSALEWSTQWARATYGALFANGRRAAGAALALNEVWYDGIGALMLRGATGNAPESPAP